jgi:tRNA(His) guanylyltransferase
MSAPGTVTIGVGDNALGVRMKERYELRTRYQLPRRTYTILRVDGKAFHSLLRHAIKPFDDQVATAMDAVAQDLCEAVQGSAFAYTQSDEVSVLMTDFASPQTEAWFDGNIQKIVSIAGGLASTSFTVRYGRVGMFDARVFTIPDRVEVANYFIWRQQDATRNSIQMLAQSLYSPKQLHMRTTNELQEMCFAKGHNWDALPPRHKRGAVVRKATDGGWFIDEAPAVFTRDRAYLEALIPVIWAEAPLCDATSTPSASTT